MNTQAGEKHKRPGQETSYECAQFAVSLCVAPCFSLYHQYKDYENKYKEIKSKERNTDWKVFVISYVLFFLYTVS